MKKVLLGCTALVAAGIIVAPHVVMAQNKKIDLQLGGYMEQWVGFTSQDDVGGAGDLNGIGTNSDTEVVFHGRTELDNGVTIGVNIQLEGNTSGDQIDESFLYISGDFGRVQLGSENSASYAMNYVAPDVGIGANSGDQTAWISFAGVGGSTGTFRGPFGSTVVEPGRANDINRVTYYSRRMSGIQFGASYAPADQEDGFGSFDRDAVIHDIWGVGLNVQETISGIDVAVSGTYGASTGAVGNPDPESWSVGLNLSFSGFTVGGSYASAEGDIGAGDMNGWDAGVSYGTGPWGVSVTYFHGERDGAGTVLAATNDTVHGSVAYSMGPGVKFVGTLGYTAIDDDSGTGTDNDAVYFVVGPKLSF